MTFFFEYDLVLLEEIDAAEVILDVICCFSRIDFELVSPHLSSVLPVVAKVKHGVHVYQRFGPT